MGGRFPTSKEERSYDAGSVGSLCSAPRDSGGGRGQEKKGVTVGALKRNEASGWGLVFGSSRDLKCIFSPAQKGEILILDLPPEMCR
jgi:hypothetical protein